MLTFETQNHCFMELKPVFEFLEALQQNNNRDWFKANEERFRQSVSIVGQLVQQLVVLELLLEYFEHHLHKLIH